MTEKEKAEELVENFASGYPIICKMNSRNMYRSESKQCALIAVDEIIQFLTQASEYLQFPEQIKYWLEVQKEIDQL